MIVLDRTRLTGWLHFFPPTAARKAAVAISCPHRALVMATDSRLSPLFITENNSLGKTPKIRRKAAAGLVP